MSNVANLKERVLQAEAERDYYKSLVDAFNTGKAPDGLSSISHIIMAQWGRKRLEARERKVPVLLGG